MKQKAMLETMVILAQDPTASKPTQPCDTNPSAPTENKTILQTNAESAMMGQQQEEAAKQFCAFEVFQKIVQQCAATAVPLIITRIYINK